MKIKITDAQRKRVTEDLDEAKIKLAQAKDRLNKTLEIAKTDSSWNEWVEEDTNRVQYYENYIASLKKILIKGEIEVA